MFEMKYVAVVLISIAFQHQNGTSTTALSMRVNGGGKKRQSISNKSTVDAIALKIGLNVVLPNKSEAGAGAKQDNKKGSTKKARRKETNQAPPTISWGKNARRFFWGDIEQGQSSVQHRSSGGRQLKVERIRNDQEFPLYRIHDVLPRRSLDRTMPLLMDGEHIISGAEELEQHELVGGEPRALRRSLVSRLTYSRDDDRSREILDRILLSGLPADLVEGGNAPPDVGRPHPYEDGSVVFYRANGNDFYSAHHDSHDPDDPPRERQRAYTVLVYLRVPHSGGGTEFPRLRTAADPKCGEESIGGVLTIKPKAGDALVWPNFDRDGKPYMDSIHGALPIPKETCRSSRRTRDDGGCNNDEDEVTKIVINLWFEGHANT